MKVDILTINMIHITYFSYYQIPRKEGYKYTYFYYPVFEGVSSYIVVRNETPLTAGEIVTIVFGTLLFLLHLL